MNEIVYACQAFEGLPEGLRLGGHRGLATVSPRLRVPTLFQEFGCPAYKTLVRAVIGLSVNLMPDASQKRLRVLCVGSDQRLLDSRRLVLAKHYEAVSLSRDDELLVLSPAEQFDVVVLCHSVSSQDSAAEIVRERWPRAKIVTLSTARTSCPTSADRIVRGLDGLAVLFQAIDSLFPSGPELACI